MKKKLMATLMTAVLAASVLAGCAGGAAPAAAPAASGDAAAPAAEEQSAAQKMEAEAADTNELADASEIKYGGTLRYASHIQPFGGYTPTNTNNASLTYMTIAYESLTSYNEDGTLRGVLAESWETDASEPSITWHLRQGVQFADGEPFNAEAVKINIEEYQSRERTETANVESMEIIDDYTLKMKLKSWNSSTLEGIGFFCYYMAPDKIDPEALATTSCGTGPFQIAEFDPGVSCKFVKNENYWQEGKPYLDAVEIYCVNEPTTRSSAFQAGEYDIIGMNNLAVAEEIAALGSTSIGKIVMCKNLSGQGAVMTGLIPNSVEEGPFQDPKVRLAMAEGLDVPALIEAFGYGMIQETNQWAVPGAVTYDPDLNAVHYDPEHAKQLLAEAGYPDGFSTRLTTDAGNKDMFTAAANMLEEIGIHCEIDLVDESAQSALYSQGNWSGIMGHFAAISPDLGLYMGRHLDKAGAFYAKGIQHPDDAMELLEAIRTAPTDEEKIKLEYEMQALMYDHENGIALFGRPLFVQNEPGFKYDYVKNEGWKTYHQNTWDIANAWLDK